MAIEVIMPRLGMATSDGTVIKWLREDGAQVLAEEPIVVVMSKKITYDVEASADGILRHVAQPRDVCPIGQVIGFLTAPGEEMPTVEKRTPAPAAAAPSVASAHSEPAAKTAVPEFVPSTPPARRLAGELGVDISKVTTSGRRITEEDVRRYHEAAARVMPDASPLARRMAEEEGLELGQVRGSGPGGRITEDDILHALEARKAPATPRSQGLPFAGMRQAIAEQMVHSLQTMAQVSMSTTADVTELKATREALGTRWGRKPSFTDLIVKAVAVALKEHPLLGSRLEANEIILPNEIHIGVAVALDDGLIVPVIRSADRLTLLEIGDRLQDLADRARRGALQVDEVTGAVFTITNLGMFGVDASTPVINPPEVAILGVGRITQHLVLIAGQIAARDVITLSLTIDHRIVDGAPGAKFLQTLAGFLEHPALVFAGPGG